MWEAPVIKETRERREQYSTKFNHNIDSIFEDICARQNKTTRKCVTFPARTPSQKQKIA
jgi:hypothetical protein